MTELIKGGQALTELELLKARTDRIERFLGKAALEGAEEDFFGRVRIFVYPDGKMPERKTDKAIGYDVYARAIVHNKEFDEETPYMRSTRFDFLSVPEDPQLKKWVYEDETQPGQYVLRLPPGQQVLIGVGFSSAPVYPLFYWLAPRSGHAMNNITIANAPGTVDPDYRGEAGVLLQNNSDDVFEVGRHMRIAQAIFMPAWVPELEAVSSHDELGQTKRQEGGFGSTGSYG